MTNILVPMAGSDAFFPREEFHFPKPLVEVAGKPLVERVVTNLAPLNGRMVFVVRQQDCQQFSLADILKLLTGDAGEILPLRYPTSGAACSALMAVDFIDDDTPLVIANGDQIISGDLPAILRDFNERDLDAGVVTFPSVHPRWSYVRIDDDGLVCEAAEKRVISHHAVAGFYYFRKGSDFVRAAQRMILRDDHHDGSFFVAPALNQLILDGKRVGHAAIDAERYHSLYSPQKMRDYETSLEKHGAGARAADAPVTVTIPMAGAGSRFATAGYTKPKPFIDVAGQPMIARVMDNLALREANYVLIAQQAHLDAETDLAAAMARDHRASYVAIDGLTEGAACTVLRARRSIDPDRPLLIANSDQLVDFDVTDFVADCFERGLDGSILVFRDRDRDPKWSFARTDANGLVREVREKQPISDLATVGIYFFTRARDYFDATLDMIAENDRTNGEFYVCPVYNYAIANGNRIGVYEIEATRMHGLGTPEDLERYLARTAETARS